MTSREEETDSSDKLRQLVTLKGTLEKRIADMRAELERLGIMLEFVNKTLLEKGFKRAEAKGAQPLTSTSQIKSEEEIVPLKTASGSLLANLHRSRDALRVVVAPHESLSVNTPPFQQFLIERVLSRMQEKDREAAERGEIPAETALSYELVLDGDLLREIDVHNPTPDRFRELRSSIHWTLEKMHEKGGKAA